jgi:hypothetical protein
LKPATTTRANFTLFKGCVGGRATFYALGGGGAAFGECVFERCEAAVGHWSAAAGQDILERCFFANTTLMGSEFLEGSVLLLNCLFAGDAPPMPSSFLTAGSQQGNTVTRIEFDTASLIATCGGLDPATPAETPTTSQAATPSEPPTETPDRPRERTPGESPKATPARTSEKTPLETPQATAAKTSGRTPERTPGETPRATLSRTRRQSPGETAQATAARTEEKSPDATPRATPSKTPERTPCETPRETPMASGSASPSSTPHSGLSRDATIGIIVGSAILVVMVIVIAVVGAHNTGQRLVTMRTCSSRRGSATSSLWQLEASSRVWV